MSVGLAGEAPTSGERSSVGDLIVHYHTLTAALRGTSQERVDLSTVTSISMIEPTTRDRGGVDLLRGNDSAVRIPFAPNQASQASSLASSLRAVLDGGAPSPALFLSTQDTGIAGLNFVGFDVETANDEWGSICQMGAVRFIDGREVASRTWLCQPPEGYQDFAQFNTTIHGISSKDVAEAPSFASCVPELVEFIGELPIVAHNAQFDSTALRRACLQAGITVPTLHFACTLALARHTEIDVANHRLPTVARALDIALERHHEATADARACADILVALAHRDHYPGGPLIDYFHSREFTLGSMDADHVVPVLSDSRGLRRAEQRKLFDAHGIAHPTPTYEAALDSASGSSDSSGEAGTQAELDLMFQATGGGSGTDDAGTSSRGSSRQPRWDAVATPDTIPEPNPDADPDDPLYDQHVTISGDFSPFDKGEIWNRIAQHGGIIGKNVTKKTTILVTGAWTKKTSKHKRAEELQQRGQHIDIWDAEKLYKLLGLEAEPPF